jgi:2'-5' RNA ligase
MPYPTEHASRQANPDKYEKIRRQNDKLGEGIHVIWGVKENGNTEVQAIRFDKDKFSPAEAKKWLKEHDYKQNLEEASGEKKAMEYNGAVVTLVPPPEVAQQLALTGDNTIAISDMHMTLCYLGDALDISPEKFKLFKHSLETWAKTQVPIKVRINGLARFTKQTEGGLQPIVVLLDSPFLSRMYEHVKDIARWDADIAVGPGYRHGFMPHITLAYIPSDEPLPIQNLPELEFNLSKLCLNMGEMRFDTELTGEMTLSTMMPTNGMYKAGAMLSSKNKGYLQKMHDNLVDYFGVKCREMPSKKNTDEPKTLREKAAKDIRENGSERNHLRFIKSTDDTILVGNYMVLWGDEDHRDMEGILSPHKNADGTNGQFFTPETEFESDFTQTDTVIVDWEHGFRPDKLGPGDEALGKVFWKSAIQDDLGLWVQRGLNRRNRYIKFLEKIGVFERGELGTSSMATKNGVRVADSGEITEWRIERDSLTFTPMEPRNIKGNELQALKSLAEEIPGIKKAYAACFGPDCDEGSSNNEQKQAVAIAKSKSLILELYSENEVF